MDRLVVIGTSFRRTGFGDLSSWTIPTPFRDHALRELRARHDVNEAVYLSTCNRSELILGVREGFSARRVTRRWREWAARIHGAGDHNQLTIQSGADAARYLFNVAASLDSLVVGETEILRQLRESLEHSASRGHSGRYLRTVVDRALKTGREVRNKTSLASLSTSVVSVAIKEVRRRMAGRRVHRALVIGAGETGRSLARSLVSLGLPAMTIVNRTVSRAEDLAEEIRRENIECAIDAAGLDRIAELAPLCDVVVSAVAAPVALVTPDLIRARSEPQLLVDLAIPPNIDPACDELAHTSLVSLPQLEAIAETNRPLLEREIERAEEIVQVGLRKLSADFRLVEATPWIRRTRDSMEQLGQQEIRAILASELGDLPDDAAARVERRLRAMVNRLMHTSTMGLKERVRSESGLLPLVHDKVHDEVRDEVRDAAELDQVTSDHASDAAERPGEVDAA